MACRRTPRQKSVDGTGGFHSRSRQRQHSLSLRIPILELLERLSRELGVGFDPVALDESCEYSQPRRLEKPKFRNGKILLILT